MRKIDKKTIFYSVISFLIITIPAKALAFCPVCSVTLVAGLGISEYYHIDDTVSGLWIGALTMSMVIWTVNWLDKKSIKFMFRKIFVLLFYYLSILIPLYLYHFIGKGFNKIWGMDKLTLSITIGSIIIIISYYFHNYLRAKNNNKVYFPFQKTIIPVSLIIIASLIFYYVTKR
ncbi:MAG: hypothetical protein WCW17_02695 [Patescibacteria group bacterium]|jgi:hypothetical protein